MSTDRDPNAIRLPDDVAQRLLARATELDERHGRTSIDQLRRAATEAGISPAAFEAALAELARGELARPAATGSSSDVRGRWVTGRFRGTLLVAGAALASILLGIGIVRSVTGAEESPAVEVEAVEVEAVEVEAVEVVPAGPVDGAVPTVDVAPAEVPAAAPPARAPAPRAP